MQSHYETLEVSPRASESVIRAAYRCLAQQHHPDKNPSSEGAGQRLTTINRAYSVLSDPAKRHDYDLQQHAPRNFEERRGNGLPSSAQRMPRAASAPTSRPFSFRPLD